MIEATLHNCMRRARESRGRTSRSISRPERRKMMARAAARICLDHDGLRPRITMPPPTLRSSIPDKIIPSAPGKCSCKRKNVAPLVAWLPGFYQQLTADLPLTDIPSCMHPRCYSLRLRNAEDIRCDGSRVALCLPLMAPMLFKHIAYIIAFLPKREGASAEKLQRKAVEASGSKQD